MKAAEDALRLVKPAVRALGAYTLAARRAPVKINQNENPYDLPDALKRRVMDLALSRPWSRYPEFDPKELIDALAAFSGWRPDGILAGNGSNELIEALLLVTVGAGTRVVIPEPTFTLYALMTRILGGEVVSVPLGPELEYDASALLQAQRESGAAVTIACTPNNPTGGVLDPREIERLCDESDGLVVVDEAYHDFSGISAVPLLAAHPNLVVLRTFSKAMSLAGARVGYLLASPELVREVNKARLPYNINFFSQMAAIATLEEWGTFRRVVDELVIERERVFGSLRTLDGVKPYPSQANFVLFELLEADPKRVFESLYADGVLVRDVTSYPRLGRALRVSIGSPAENDAFLASLRKAVGEVKAKGGPA
jgi:histidinol-phosphate aminotransferase